jgi:CRP-like cAMP-binding protein
MADAADMQAEIEALRAQVEAMGAVPVGAAAARAATARKKGVAICAEQVDDDFEAPSFPKGPGTRVLIEGAMSASSMFNNLSREQREAVIGAMYPAQRPAGEPVIVHGEPAQNYFIVDAGKCDVFVRRENGAEELVLTIGSGASFGEIALMYESTNTITIKAHVDVTVWTIDRHTFRSIVVNSASKRRQQYEAIIAGVSLFESLSKPERAVMADALEDVVYPDGHSIMQQGEEGDYFCESRASRVQAAPSLDSAFAAARRHHHERQGLCGGGRAGAGGAARGRRVLRGEGAAHE